MHGPGHLLPTLARSRPSARTAALLIPLLVVLLVGQLPLPASHSVNAAAAGYQPGEAIPVWAAASETVAEIMARQAAPEQQGPSGTAKPRLAQDRSGLAQNPNSPRRGSWPPSAGSSSIQQATSAQNDLPINFTASTFTEAGSLPPDTMGAIGPNQYVITLNGRVKSFDRNGNPGALNVDMDAFFAGIRNGKRTSDPRIRYDRLSGRWFILIINVDIPNRVLLAVSSGPDIVNETSFSYYYFLQHEALPAGDSTCIADYPTLGIDAQALYIGVNQFCGASVNVAAFTGTSAFVIRKSQLVSSPPPSGSQITATAFRNLGTRDASGPYTPQGVDNFDPAPAFGYIVGVDTKDFGKLYLRRIADPGSATPTISGNIVLDVPQTSFPLTVPHLGNNNGSSGRLDALDDRLFAAHLRNGRLWTAHNIGVDSSGNAGLNTFATRTGIRWYELKDLDTAPALAQSGTVFDPAASNPLYYWIPAMMVSGQGHVALGMSVAGETARADAAYAYRLAGSTPGTFGAPMTYTASATAYNPLQDPGSISGRRWGDYSFTSLDPCDDMSMWTIQEFTAATDVWGVRVAKILAPPPAAIASVSPARVQGGSSSVNLVVSGISANGSGYFDPGAGFNCRLSASVSNGVVVNSVTYLGPTAVQLNVSTLAAANGPATITITNPDGQSVSANALLNIDTMTPFTTTAGGPSFELRVFGSGFLTDTQILWNGLPLPTSFISGTMVTTVVPSNLVANAGTAFITTFTASTNVTSFPQLFTVYNLTPVLVSIDPASVPYGSADAPATVTGTNFLSGVVASVAGQPVPTTFVSGTSATIVVPAARLQAAGTLTVTMQNPAPSFPSNPLPITVRPPVIFIPQTRREYPE